MNFMKFNNTKYKVLHLVQGNHKHPYRLDDEQIESSPVKMNLGVVVDEKLNMSHQYVLTAHKARLREGGDSLSLCSPLVRSHLQ